MSSGSFLEYYRRSLSELGLVVEPGHEITEPLPRSLPASLVAWYQVAGDSPVNSMHNRLLPPDRLEQRDTKVIFAEENQVVVVWAFDEADKSDDPEVWQGQPASKGWDDGFEWYSEELPLSRFIIEMLRNTIDVDGPEQPSDPYG